ncbi:9812_t:CDS:2, partial [Racocetra fulgida]
EDITTELIRILTQFITKYCHNTGLDMQKICNIQNDNTNIETNSSTINIEPNNRQPLIDTSSRYNITKQKPNREQRICSYCLDKGHNICRCTQYKADLVNKEN